MPSNNRATSPDLYRAFYLSVIVTNKLEGEKGTIKLDTIFRVYQVILEDGHIDRLDSILDEIKERTTH